MSNYFNFHKIVYFLFFVFFLVISGYYFISAPTNNRSIANRQPTIIHIERKESLDAIALDLESKNIIRYHFVLKIFITIFNLDRQIERGDYLFDKNVSTLNVAWMLARGDHHINPIKITFKEGITNIEMATILSDKLISFRRDLFLSDKRSLQGYLFPDTYFFFPMTTSNEVIDEMSANFIKRIRPLKEDIINSNHTLGDIIIMASIIEKEAKGKDDASIISGILWKRIERGMLLQVDAVKETYNKNGLPKEAISNPGIISIEAAIHPVDSSYLFYLHDKNGLAHFAKTFAEHKSNINKYLK